MKRNHWFKRTAGLALALAVLLVSSMCSCALAEGKTFTFIVNGDAGNVFNPFGINDRSKVVVAAPMMSPIYRTGADGSVIPILAQSIEPSEDGLTYTLKLKET